MSAATGNKFTDTFNSANPNSARVTSGRTAGTFTLACDNLAGWPTVSKVHFATYKIDTNSAKVAGTQIDWYGIVSGNSIGSMSRLAGATDAGNAIGDVVEMMPTGSWAHDLYSGLTAEHNQDGTHAAVTATSVASAGTVTGTTGVFSSDVSDNATTLKTYRSDYAFDFVQSGLVWSGDAYASTKAASMTAGVVYINGQRGVISAVTARTFTASKDTYVDILNTAGVFTVVYTEVTNNAASPALAANSLRIGIVVTGATNIAAATSINQGQETMVLPIASSIPYAVTDSLGNLICPRDPNRKILGYRQILADFTLSASQTTATQVTGLTCPVIVPTGRKVKITTYTYFAKQSTSTNNVQPSIWDGTVNSGTALQSGVHYVPTNNYGTPMTIEVLNTPATTSKTYNTGIQSNALTNVVFSATATNPAFIKVELV